MSDKDAFKLVYLARRAKTVAREDWPRTWKSHAVFASQFPIMEAEINWLRYCNRVDRPTIDGEPIDLPQLSTEHDGAAIAASRTLEGIDGRGISAEDQKKIDDDERRVFDILTPHFTFFTVETKVKDGPLGKSALLHFLPRAAGLARPQFTERYKAFENRMRAAIGPAPALTRCVFNHPVNEEKPLFPFDGITETWFETDEDAARALASGIFDGLADDLAAFCDLDRSVMLLTKVCHRWSEP